MTIRIKQLNLPDQTDQEKTGRLDYRVDIGDKHYDVFIKGNEIAKSDGMEPALPLGLLAGMRLGRNIHVEGLLSNDYLCGVRKVVEHFSTNFDQFDSVEISCNGIIDKPPIKSERVASFFSGGVDSFFTLLKYKEQLTDIIYIYGFDVRLDDEQRRETIHAMGSTVAAEFGLNFIEVESNLSKVIEDFGSWSQHGHGMALASIARSLATNIGEVIIPGSHSKKSQQIWGSSLLTDPLYSDNSLSIIHDTCEAERIDKVERLAKEPLALKYLRVCWENIDGAYNCCRCEKCLRTMCSLDAIGALDKAESFPLPLTTKAVAGALHFTPKTRDFPLQNIELYKRYGKDDTPIIGALIKQISRPIWVAFQYKKWRKRGARWKGHFKKLRSYIYGVD
jgi:hypothetical protein